MNVSYGVVCISAISYLYHIQNYRFTELNVNDFRKISKMFISMHSNHIYRRNGYFYTTLLYWFYETIFLLHENVNSDTTFANFVGQTLECYNLIIINTSEEIGNVLFIENRADTLTLIHVVLLRHQHYVNNDVCIMFYIFFISFKCRPTAHVYIWLHDVQNT